MSRDAAALFGEFYAEREEARSADGSDAYRSGKASGLAARLAGTLHLVWGGDEATEIERRHVEAAIEIHGWLAAHAERIQEEMGSGGRRSLEHAIATRLKEKGLSPVTVREVWQMTKNRSDVESTDDIRRAIGKLELLGYVAEIPPAGRRRQGRPSANYAVNPELLSRDFAIESHSAAPMPKEPVTGAAVAPHAAHDWLGGLKLGD